ncbi:unnamed protein product [Ostreobium quekettii]|uniref:Uncharacterized protein n=1 Tax=Ostreobium quekettii TaxID=121088 RepID=A0A8S1IT02_9CHLO|nr:unnamed protein product [Ostreobium quekettii]
MSFCSVDVNVKELEESAPVGKSFLEAFGAQRHLSLQEEILRDLQSRVINGEISIDDPELQKLDPQTLEALFGAYEAAGPCLKLSHQCPSPKPVPPNSPSDYHEDTKDGALESVQRGPHSPQSEQAPLVAPQEQSASLADDACSAKASAEGAESQVVEEVQVACFDSNGIDAVTDGCGGQRGRMPEGDLQKLSNRILAGKARLDEVELRNLHPDDAAVIANIQDLAPPRGERSDSSSAEADSPAERPDDTTSLKVDESVQKLDGSITSSDRGARHAEAANERSQEVEGQEGFGPTSGSNPATHDRGYGDGTVASAGAEGVGSASEDGAGNFAERISSQLSRVPDCPESIAEAVSTCCYFENTISSRYKGMKENRLSVHDATTAFLYFAFKTLEDLVGGEELLAAVDHSMYLMAATRQGRENATEGTEGISAKCASPEGASAQEQVEDPAEQDKAVGLTEAGSGDGDVIAITETPDASVDVKCDATPQMEAGDVTSPGGAAGAPSPDRHAEERAEAVGASPSREGSPGEAPEQDENVPETSQSQGARKSPVGTGSGKNFPETSESPDIRKSLVGTGEVENVPETSQSPEIGTSPLGKGRSENLPETSQSTEIETSPQGAELFCKKQQRGGFDIRGGWAPPKKKGRTWEGERTITFDDAQVEPGGYKLIPGLSDDDQPQRFGEPLRDRFSSDEEGVAEKTEFDCAAGGDERMGDYEEDDGNGNEEKDESGEGVEEEDEELLFEDEEDMGGGEGYERARGRDGLEEDRFDCRRSRIGDDDDDDAIRIPGLSGSDVERCPRWEGGGGLGICGKRDWNGGRRAHVGKGGRRGGSFGGCQGQRGPLWSHRKDRQKNGTLPLGGKARGRGVRW